MSDILILPVASASLAFGLDWLPLLDGRADRMAYRVARRHRASHLVAAGSFAAAVGLAHLSPRGGGRGVPLHSAAQNMARLFPAGTIALLMALDESRHWLVAVHEGTVVARTDKIHACADDARESLEELRQAFPQLMLLDESQAPSLRDIAAASGEPSRLRRAHRWHGGAAGLLRWGLLLLALAFVPPRIWKLWKASAPAQQELPRVDAGRAWLDAQDKAGRAIAVHGVHGTRAALQELYRLPVRLAGWSLLGADCQPQAGNWYCKARYQRKGPHASNAGFIEAAGPGWAVEFPSMDQAEPSWRAGAPALPLTAATVRSVAYNQRHLWSSLQSIQAAFSSMQLGRPAPMAVAAPRDAHGQPIVRPPGSPVYTLRQVVFDGPMRSAAVLLPYTESISWKKIVLSFHDRREATLKASRFHVSLHGDLYEIQSEPLDAAPGVAPHSGQAAASPISSS